jgi:hypothetical protein
MRDGRTHRGSVAVVIALAGIVVLTIGAGRGAPAGSPQSAVLVPAATQIISFDDTVGRLDTVTGAVYRLRGNLENPSVRHTWQLRVQPVTGRTSGLLEIQRATFNKPSAIFLVDKVTGRTWILRQRASETRSWDPVPIM